MKFKVQAHVTYKCRYHIIWIPKYRRKTLVAGVDKYFEKVMDTVISERYPDVVVLERSIQADHLHLLLEIPPKYSVSTIVGNIKSNTARMMRKKFEYLARSSEMWSVGYFVSTVGTNETMIKDYIQNQEEQDTGRAELVLGKDTTGEV
jgi:putative transposase